MTDIDNFERTWQGLTHGQVEDAIKAKVSQMENAIEDAADQGYAPPEGGIPKSDLSTEVQKLLNKANTALQSGDISTLQSTVTSLQAALNALIGSGNVQGAIDTFNEVVAFLNGINSSDTLAAKLAQIATDIATKANDNAVVKSVSVNGQTPQTPTNGNVNISVEGIAGDDGKSAYQSYLDTTSDNPKKTEAEWVASLKGDKGDTGNFVLADGDFNNLTIVNDLNGGNGVLDARQGKVIGDLLDDLDARLDEIEGAMTAYMNGTTLVIAPLVGTDPLVIATTTDRSTLPCIAGGSTVTKFSVLGRRLTGNIGISLSGSGRSSFSLSANSLTPVGGKVAATEITVTYNPAAGSANNTQHQCTINVTYDGVTYAQISLTGQVTANSVLTVTPLSLNIPTASGVQASGTIHVEGSALAGNVTLTLSDDTNLSFDDSSTLGETTILKDNAEQSGGVDVPVYFDGNASSVNATVTVTSSGAASVNVAISAFIPSAKPEGTEFVDENLHLKFTVLADTTKVAVTGYQVPTNADIEIPSTVSDAGKTCSLNGVETTGDGFLYAVTEVKSPGSTTTTVSHFANAKSIIIPNSVTTIGSMAFRQATLLQSVVMSTSVTTIPSSCFENCTSLSSISGLTNVDYAQGSSFRGCTSLLSLSLPNLTSMSTYAFYSTPLERFLMKGASITANSFKQVASGCDFYITKNSVVGMGAGTDKWWKNAFPATEVNGEEKINIVLHVPSNLLSSYQAHSQWKDAKEIIGETTMPTE